MTSYSLFETKNNVYFGASLKLSDNWENTQKYENFNKLAAKALGVFF